VISIGAPGVPRSSPDYHAITLMNTILGGSFTSRLNDELRERTTVPPAGAVRVRLLAVSVLNGLVSGDGQKSRGFADDRLGGLRPISSFF
jgi:hypothetical protein